MKKKIGDLTLREIVKEHKNRKDCRGCPYDSNHITNDYKPSNCRWITRSENSKRVIHKKRG